jgi:hypothetical protein
MKDQDAPSSAAAAESAGHRAEITHRLRAERPPLNLGRRLFAFPTGIAALLCAVGTVALLLSLRLSLALVLFGVGWLLSVATWRWGRGLPLARHIGARAEDIARLDE